MANIVVNEPEFYAQKEIFAEAILLPNNFVVRLIKDNHMKNNYYPQYLLMAGLMLSGQVLAEYELPAGAKTGALDLALQHHCFTCHTMVKKSIGPAWKDIAAKYRADASAEDQLVIKVSQGGNGVWGKEMAMPAFSPHVNETDIRTMVQYVLSLK
jgi:cytochrome c